MIMNFDGLNMCLCMECANEEIDQFVNMYISCDVSLLPNPLQNA